MSEQPKLIESVEEWRRALDENALQAGDGNTWTSIDHGIPIRDVRVLIDQIEKGMWRWKPEEYEYVTMESFRLGDLEYYEIYREAYDKWERLNDGLPLRAILTVVKDSQIRRKKVEGGGEIELVEWKHAQHGYALYTPKGQSPRSDPFCQTGRTIKEVIHEE